MLFSLLADDAKLGEDFNPVVRVEVSETPTAALPLPSRSSFPAAGWKLLVPNTGPLYPPSPLPSRSWMDKNVVQPFIAPLVKKDQGGGGS